MTQSTNSSNSHFHGVMPDQAPPKITQLFIPAEDRSDSTPEVSIVVPALNEHITIGEFVDWCWEGLKKGGIKGEVIIVDSSSDDTPRIALEHGARVLRTPKRGLGQAYIDSIPFIRSNFIIMGDCDLTYDFREIDCFVKSYRLGNDYVMGSRFLGSIESGAMPKLHQYFGTPLTTWILNRIYKSNYTDIHCGMRGLTKSALERINLTSSGWEYASEMVLKAVRVNLKISEVPVTFYKDREGRESHLKRGGIFTPWIAGWINLKVMLVFSPDSFLIKPGFLFACIGLFFSLISLPGTIKVGVLGFGIYMQMLGLAMIVLGYSLFQTGIIARNIHGLRSGMIESFVDKYLTYNRGMLTVALLCSLGLIIDFNFLLEYLKSGSTILHLSSSAIFGLLLIIFGVQTFSFTLLLDLNRRMRKN